MSVIVSTFPSFNTFNSRSWTLAMIIALHAGFFWLLSSGGISVIYPPPPKEMELMPLDRLKPPPRPVPPIDIADPAPLLDPIPIPPQPRPLEFDPEETVTRREEPVGPTAPAAATAHEPVITQPGIDPRLGLSEPAYPASERRLEHAGTVLLAIEVLENGRVGQVRVEQSSGYERLDEAAVRQASRWKLKPGMRDGVPVAMWKRIPVHFRLTEPAKNL